jgi:hypothetical protein
VSRLTLVIIGSALALAACQTEPGTRFLSSEDSVSFIRPDGWKQHRDRGTLILSLGEEATSPNTIAVRTIAREDGWAEDRTVETVVPATQTVLRALPGSQVSEPAPITERGMMSRGGRTDRFGGGQTDHRIGRDVIAVFGVDAVDGPGAAKLTTGEVHQAVAADVAEAAFRRRRGGGLR